MQTAAASNFDALTQRAQLGRLARKSYQLHKDLAATLGADAIGYRAVDTVSLAVAAGGGGGAAARAGRKGGQLPGWLDGGGIVQSSSIGTTATTAQVRRRLCNSKLPVQLCAGCNWQCLQLHAAGCDRRFA